MKFVFPILSLSLLLAGCVTPAPQAALPEVQSQLAARTAATVTWPLTPEEISQTETAVRELLAADLTADSAVRIALLNNRSLRATFEELGLSQARLAAASRLPNPHFDASVRWPHNSPHGPNVEFGLSAPLLESLLLPRRRAIAEGERLQVQYQVSHEVLALVAAVRQAAYTVLAEQDLRARLAVIAEISAAASEFARRQFDAGNIAELDLRQISASAQQAHLELIRADGRVRAAREELNDLLGLNPDQVGWTMSGGLPALPSIDTLPEALEAAALETRLDLAALRAQADTAGKALSLKQSTRLLPGDAELGLNTEREPDGERITGPTLSLQLPLFDQGQTEVARLSAEHRQAQDRVAALSATIGSQARAARNRLLTARQAAEFHQQTLLPQRRAILQETLLHYNAMHKGVYELLAAKEQQQLTEREAVESLHDYWSARTNLEQALGRQLPLAEPATPPPEPEEPAAADHSHHHGHD